MIRVDPTRTPDGVAPPTRLDATINDPFTSLPVFVYGKTQTYLAEVWRIADGSEYVVVHDAPWNTSLENAQEKILAAVHQEWPGATVIEFWPRGLPLGNCYRYSSTTPGGGGRKVDHAHLDKIGLFLKEPREI